MKINKKKNFPKTVSVVIPVYSTRNLIEKNLPKVVDAMNNKKNKIIEIIVVDDASYDDSYEYLRKNFPQVKTIRHKINRGFSASVNTGARTAKGDLIVLLNSDVIPDKDFMIPVFKHFNDENVFAISLHERGYSWAKGSFKNGYIEHEQAKVSKNVHETFWVSGGSGVYRSDYWKKLGGMDEKVLSPFYWEDIDLCYRAAKRGLINLWEPKAMVVHHHESTVSKLSKEYVGRVRERNQLLFHWKNITSASLFRKHIRGMVERVFKGPGYLRIILMALMRYRIVMKARKIEKKETKVSDEAIFAKFSI